MWTIKRILILVSGLLVCLMGFGLYTLALGFDGLAALPEQYQRGIITAEHEPPPPPPVDAKLKLAFGNGSEELRRPLRLWLPDKGIAFAAGDFNIESKDGRVRLAPFSAAIFHKGKPGKHPEISTLRSRVAILTLDKPANNHTELATRKIIAVELQGGRPGVTLGNNRGTPEKTDDLDILVLNGSLFFEERRNLIWTEGVVCLTDFQSKPATVIRGKHLEMFLAPKITDPTPAAKADAKAQRGNLSNDAKNIEKLVLHSDVEMRFWVDARAGFLGGAPSTKTPPPPVSLPNDEANPPDKAQIIVKTGGMFVYDLKKEFAWFESPPPREEKSSVEQIAPDQVHVQRSQKIDGKNKFDQLTCDRLELQFRAKLAPVGAAADSSSTNKEVETARATCRAGGDVALALDSEHMAAYGNEFFYRAGNLVDGPLTVLKGDPLRSIKDGHLMKCKELHLFGANRAGDGQKLWAKGKGRIDMLDAKNAQKEDFPIHVTWNDQLTVTKVKEGNQILDLITVLGDASFVDDQKLQDLHGEKIQVWLRQRPKGSKDATAGAQQQELHRVFVQERVRAKSPEFIVRQANTMTMTFLPTVAANSRLPDAPEKGPTDAKGPTEVKPPTGPMETKPLAEEKKPRTPIELQASDITATVASVGTKELHELVARGNVFVFQAGEKPGEKRIDITGQLLTVNKVSEKGDLLIVHGDKKAPARLELGDIVLSGAVVSINQDTNRTDVDGAGVMEMPTNKNLDGTDSAKKNARIKVLWHKNMTFDGKHASFVGGVQAQEIGAPSWMLCDEMTTILDQRVSLKDNDKAGKGAKLDRIICDKNIFIDDSKVDDKRALVQRHILQGRELVNYEDGRTHVVGPGQVKLLAKGGAEPGLAPMGGNAPPNAAPAKAEWKLTHIRFRSHMHGNNKAETKTAKFYGEYGGVEVFHFPTNDIKATMNPDAPPKDGMYLRCEMLEVEERKEMGRVNHTMIGRQNVFFRTDKHQGTADIVKYDEANDIVIFEALNDKVVRLFQINNNGEPTPAAVSSSKVLYHRKTGKIETEGVRSITN